MLQSKTVRSLIALMAFLPAFAGLALSQSDIQGNASSAVLSPESFFGQPSNESYANKYEGQAIVHRDPSKAPITDRMFIGGSLGASFGDIIYVDVSPLVGYRVTDHFRGGVGFTYQYLNDRYYNYKYHLYGPRVFVQHDVWDGLFAHAEYEYLFLKFITGDFIPVELDETYPGLLLGGGYNFEVSQNSTFGIMALYNVLFDSFNSIYASPWVIRVAVQLGL